MRSIKRLWSLSFLDRSLLAESFVVLALIKAGLWLLPFRALRRLLRIDLESDPQNALVDRAYERKVVWAIDAVGHRLPIFKNCLNRALATQLLLRRRGRRAKLQFGVIRNSEGRVEFHAWLERDGEIIIGALSDLASYSPLGSFKERV